MYAGEWFSHGFLMVLLSLIRDNIHSNNVGLLFEIEGNEILRTYCNIRHKPSAFNCNTLYNTALNLFIYLKGNSEFPLPINVETIT